MAERVLFGLLSLDSIARMRPVAPATLIEQRLRATWLAGEPRAALAAIKLEEGADALRLEQLSQPQAANMRVLPHEQNVCRRHPALTARAVLRARRRSPSGMFACGGELSGPAALR